jgi:hypothetical protein
MDLLPDTANPSTGEHRDRDVTGYVDRHRGESPPASQSPHRLQTARVDQGDALCQGIVSDRFALSPRPAGVPIEEPSRSRHIRMTKAKRTSSVT